MLFRSPSAATEALLQRTSDAIRFSSSSNPFSRVVTRASAVLTPAAIALTARSERLRSSLSSLAATFSLVRRVRGALWKGEEVENWRQSRSRSLLQPTTKVARESEERRGTAWRELARKDRREAQSIFKVCWASWGLHKAKLALRSRRCRSEKECFLACFFVLRGRAEIAALAVSLRSQVCV